MTIDQLVDSLVFIEKVENGLADSASNRVYSKEQQQKQKPPKAQKTTPEQADQQRKKTPPKPQALRFPLKDRPDGGFRGKEKEEGKNAESLTAQGF